MREKTSKIFLILTVTLVPLIFTNLILSERITNYNSLGDVNHSNLNMNPGYTNCEKIINDTRVNNYTIGDQYGASLCALSSEKFVVSWISEGLDPDNSWGVYTKVYNANTGKNITNKFRINHYYSGEQLGAPFCRLSNDTFVAAWISEGQDPDGSPGIYARVFNATSGKNITKEFRINNFTAGVQEFPSICALSSETFVAAWTSEGQDPDSSGGIYACVYNATSGKNITREFRINYNITGIQDWPQICALSNDTFAVAWDGPGQITTEKDVYMSVFNDTTGKNITHEFRVNEFYLGFQYEPKICSLSSDQFLVSWVSYTQDGSGHGVYAKIFNAKNGKNVTIDILINNYTENSQSAVSICALSSERFVATWMSGLQDGDQDGVYARVFNSLTGTNITREFRVNGYTLNSQEDPSICALSHDKFIILWNSFGPDNDNIDAYFSIFQVIDYNQTLTEPPPFNPFIVGFIIILLLGVIGLTSILIFYKIRISKKKG